MDHRFRVNEDLKMGFATQRNAKKSPPCSPRARSAINAMWESTETTMLTTLIISAKTFHVSAACAFGRLAASSIYDRVKMQSYAYEG